MLRTLPDFIRELYWELEKGENGTPHVQGCLRLKTQQRTTFLLKHFLARAHYTGLGSAEYQENMKKYAMKQDATATSGVVSARNTEPILFPAVIPEMIVKEWFELDIEVCQRALPSGEEEPWLLRKYDEISFEEAYDRAARALVKKYRVETLVCRPEVKTSTRLYYKEIYDRIIHNRNANEENHETEAHEAELPDCEESSSTCSASEARPEQ